jgi:hypothetical protein
MFDQVLADGEFNPGQADPLQMAHWGEDRTVKASVLCQLLADKGLPTQGVRLRNLRISGQLNLRSATLRRPLHLTSCYFDSPVILDYAKVALLILDRCRLAGGLHGDTLVVTKGLELIGSTLDGPVMLPDASVRGHFKCTDSNLTQPIGDEAAVKEYLGHYALIGDGMKVSGDVRLNGTFTAAGVLLSGAHIGGTLDCADATLTNVSDKDPDSKDLTGKDYCFRGSGMQVDGDVIFDRCTAGGNGIRLSDADIAGELLCQGTKLNGADRGGNALRANDIKVGSNVSISSDFTAGGGKISIKQAVIAGNLSLRPKRLGQDDNGVAFDATGTQITQRLIWSPQEQVLGKVVLERMVVSQLDDYWKDKDGLRPHGYWPTDGMLRLDGLTYGGIRSIAAGKADAKQRLEWISYQYKPAVGFRAAWKGWRDKESTPADQVPPADPPEFATQPYRQLADVYRGEGRDADARRLAIAQRRDLRAFGKLTNAAKVGNWLLDNTIRYGYRTWRAAILLAILYAAVAIFFWVARSHDALIAVQSTPGITGTTSLKDSACTASYPCFNPFGYAFDTVIPIINVHQADFWTPNAYASSPWDWLSVWITYVSTGLGWLFVTLAVAGYTGLARNASSP